MKRILLLTTLLIGCMSVGMGQTPKKHVFYDTVKTVKERIDYSPDTIAVYFKELVIGIAEQSVQEKWVKGFVIWQTYKQSNLTTLTSSGTWGIASKPYYVDSFEPSKLVDGIFLYSDRKTKVTNPIIFTIKR